MRFLLTAGPTRESIDAVRYISNRSSGQMGLALAEAIVAAGYELTAIYGPIPLRDTPTYPCEFVQTAEQMRLAVLNHWPRCDVLVMAAAVADFRPLRSQVSKLPRGEGLTIQCEPTVDIVAQAAAQKRPDQLVVAFSLEAQNDLARAEEKMLRKKVDMMVFNPLETMDQPTIHATLLRPGQSPEELSPLAKTRFAELLVARIIQLPQQRAQACG